MSSKVVPQIFGPELVIDSTPTVLGGGATGSGSVSQGSQQPVNTGMYSKVVNPYRAQLENNSYQQSFWDRFGNWLGFNTKEDSYRLELERLANEFDADLQLQDITNEYNSEESQANRQREAGINPDLNGVDSAAATSDKPKGADSSNLSNIESMTTGQEIVPLVQTFSSVLTTALGDVSGMIGMFQDTTSRHLANQSQMLHSMEYAYDFGGKVMEKGFSTGAFDAAAKEANLANAVLKDGKWVDKATGLELLPEERAVGSYDAFLNRFGFKNNRLSKKLWNSYRSGAMDFLNGEIGRRKQFQNHNELVEAQVETKTNEAKGFEVDNLNPVFQPLAPFIKDNFEYCIKADYYANRNFAEFERIRDAARAAIAENNKNKYIGDYYGELNGETAAEAANTSNQLTRDYNQESISLDLARSKARVEKLQNEVEKLGLDWEKKLFTYNTNIVEMFGPNTPAFIQYTMMSVLGNISGNLYKSLRQFRAQNRQAASETLGIIGDAVSIFSPIKKPRPIMP